MFSFPFFTVKEIHFCVKLTKSPAIFYLNPSVFSDFICLSQPPYMHIHIKEPDKDSKEIDIDDVNSLLRAGLLSVDCLAWMPGLDSWVTLKEIPGITYNPSLPTKIIYPPSLPPASSFDTSALSFTEGAARKPINPFLAYFLPIGRICRWSWWNRCVGNFLVPCLILGPLDKMLPSTVLGSILILVWAYLLVVTAAKRLHDMNVSGWLAPIAFIPVIGFIILLIPSSTETNQYGPYVKPKAFFQL